MLWIITAAVMGAAAAWGPIVSNSVEQPNYQIVASQDAIELREYSSIIVAETTATGERKESINAGFRTLADYIFGNNSSKTAISMTSPVTQSTQNEKIAMTAPVMQQQNDKGWVVRFSMPSEYTLQTLPTPNNNAVKLLQIPASRMAVIRFSGLADDETLATQTAILNGYIASEKLTPLAPATYAFYNPPWTLPFLRRNEVMIPVK